jgi:hypothetical protein
MCNWKSCSQASPLTNKFSAFTVNAKAVKYGRVEGENMEIVLEAL